jgi:exopolysaccharide biosynthesis predicted pyruvyltransferase EpsI
MSLDTLNFLSVFKNKYEKIKYIPNPGNAGDSMIAFATLKLFEDLGLDFSIDKFNKKYDGDVLVYGGGGNLTDKYDSLRNFLWKNYRKNEILILPHTICHCTPLLKALGPNVKIIAREKVSFNYIKTHMKHPENALLSDDMAFHIDNLDAYKNQPHIGTCNAFRLDAEKTNIKIPEPNKDVSTNFSRGQNTQNKDHIAISTDNMFSYLCKFTEINTNRLHVSIAGALLGRKVNLYPNSYYKNKAVFDFSMKDKFKNVQFIES